MEPEILSHEGESKCTPSVNTLLDQNGSSYIPCVLNCATGCIGFCPMDYVRVKIQ